MVQVGQLSVTDEIMQILRPNKKISVFRVMGLKILGRVGTCICLKNLVLKTTGSKYPPPPPPRTPSYKIIKLIDLMLLS